ncbi:MAG: MaoC family dehydratase N-terminal domain-containing protein [Spirochaetes bacterium]|nr:MaoC family dehydratase N-terminal domain-containing protein [Spirochaetota bacterium]
MISDISKIILSSFSKKMNPGSVGTESVINDVSAEYAKFSGFAEIIGDNFYDIDRDNPVIPPFFIAAVAYPAIKELMFSKILKANLLRLVHAEQDISVFRNINPDERFNIKAVIDSINTVSAGEIVNIISNVTSSGKNEPLMQSRTSFLIRGQKKPSSGKKNEDSFESVSEFKVAVPFDQAKKYAEVSGDKNPIHVNRFAAKAAGLPGTILHGMCTLGMVNSVLVRELCRSDYNRYAGISGRFSKYVLPGDVLSIETGRRVKDFYMFEVKNVSGKPVISNGKFFVR